MKNTLLACALIATTSLSAHSAHAASSWGIDHEKITRVDAKVVDLLCEITGNCVAKCGNGKRQLGLLFDDGRLVPVVKNSEPFAGATPDLIRFCNKKVTADGLMISSPKMPLFALQFKRLAPDGKWSRANQFGKDWSRANGGKKPGQWFRQDIIVKKLIREQGILGIPGLKPEE